MSIGSRIYSQLPVGVDNTIRVAQEHDLSFVFVFVPAIFSHAGQIHQAVLDLMHNQIKLKLELMIDPHTQETKIQLTCVINRTAFRSTFLLLLRLGHLHISFDAYLDINITISIS